MVKSLRDQIIRRQTLPNSSRKISIYGTPTCYYCSRAKEFCDLNALDYAYTDISGYNAVELTQLITIANGYTKVPIVFVDGNFVGGFDALKEVLRS